MTTLIRSGIARNISNNIRGLQVSNHVRSNITPPSCDIRRGPIEYDQALGSGTHMLIMLVRAYLANPWDTQAVNRLESYLEPEGDNSIKAAIESDTTLDGLVADLHVASCSGENPYLAEGQGPVLGAEWTVVVWL